jgi:hypothetical protein
VKRILLTGARGRIGPTVFDACQGDYAFTLADTEPASRALSEPHRAVTADLSNADEIAGLCAEGDAVVPRDDAFATFDIPVR